MAEPPNVGNGKTVAILGAGIAGMVAALEMTRLGYACTVLEAQATAGGRVRTIRSGDVVNEIDSTQTCQFDISDSLYFNAGPSRIAQHHELLLGYCRDFGVALETLHQRQSRCLVAFAECLRRSAAIGEEGARRYTWWNCGATFNNNYVATSRAGFPGQENIGSRQRGELLPARQLQQLVADIFWELRTSFSQGFDQQPTMLQPVGGMGRIARAFESQVSNDIIYEAVVSEIRKTANGTRIIYSDRLGAPQVLDTDYSIVTIPAPVLAGIPNDLSASHQAEIAGFQYSSAVRVAFQATRFWEQDHNTYGGITWTNQDITQIWYPNHGFQDPNGIILGAYIFDGPAGTAFTNQSPQQRLDTAVQQASNVHPQFSTEALHGIGVAWKKMPFQLGGWGTSNPSTLLSADRNIFFAGEHLSILQGWQEGAILSAYAAVDGIVARDLMT